MIVLTVDKTMELHRIMSEATGGDAGVRDMGLLDSAVNAPLQTFGGEELYPTREEKAARLAHSLIVNHPFVDGNKRIGIYAMLVFLEVNGVNFCPTVGEVARVGLAVADGKMGYEDILSWVKNNTK